MLSLSIVCPECASPPGQRCSTTGGSYTIEPGGMWTHQVRYNSAHQSIVVTVPHPVLDPLAKSIEPIDPNHGDGHHEFPVGVPLSEMVGADGRRIPPPASTDDQIDVGVAAAAMLANFAVVPVVPPEGCDGQNRGICPVCAPETALPPTSPEPPVE